MDTKRPLTYGFVGLGLMGGSLARAVRNLDGPELDQRARITACDIHHLSLQQALEAGIIDEGFPAEKAACMLSKCDIVFICLYPHATAEFIEMHRDDFKSGSIVTDIAGVKAGLLARFPNGIRDDVDFIPGHPMAGSEKEGYIHSSASIFKGRNYILMPLPSNKPENVAFLKTLIADIGFSRIIETSAAVHDHKIAFTSQLCHVIASALVESAEDTNITAFGGGSFEDLTRIAMINAPLWTELFLTNKKELVSHIESFEQTLAHIKELIHSDSSSELQDILEGVRAKRMVMAKT